jgi:ribosomal protein L30E
MKFNITTYKTLIGQKNVIEIPKKKQAQWVVLENNTPKYWVDCFDLYTESNVIMNSLVIGARQSISDVLKRISKKNRVKLSVQSAPLLGYKVKTEEVVLNLEHIPENWLSYTL